MDLKFLIFHFLSLHLITGQDYKPRCPSDITVSIGCPVGWNSYLANCYQFNKYSTLTYQPARDSCNKLGARLLRINDRTQYQFISDMLNNIAVNRSINWYTAAMIDPAYQGRFIWDGYPTELKLFNVDLLNLFIDLPDLNNPLAFGSDRTRVALTYYNMKWALNVTTSMDNSYFICEASKSLINKATSLVRGADFGQSDLTNVVRGPCITIQPTDQLFVPMIVKSKIVTFSCGVYGNPMPTVTWYFTIDTPTGPVRKIIDPFQYKNGQVSQTGGLLSITDPDNTFDNKIHCQATNDYGTVVSKQVQIIRGRLDLYNKNARQTKTINDNTGFLLDCEAPNHSPPDSIDYTFYITRSNDKGIVIDDIIQSQLRNNIFLSFNLGLIGFSIASSKDSGIYKCMIGWKGLTGTYYKSPDIPLVVTPSNVLYPAPAVNDKFPNFRPSNPFLGDNVDFECFGYGEIKQNALIYIWKWNGNNLPSKGIISDFGRRLRLEKVQFEDQGIYSCYIQTYDGRVSSSRQIQLSINAKPTFVVKPTNQYPDVGSLVNIGCQAIGKPQVTIKWYRNDVTLSSWLLANPDPRYNFSDGNISQALLSISSIQSSDNAMIGCVVSNTFGTESAFIELKTMSIAPNFNKYPLMNTEAILSTNIIIPCQPEGSPTPSIVWNFNGGALSLSPSFFNQITGVIDCNAHTCLLPNNNLFIKSVAMADKGNYSCVATNSLGTITSSAYLDIINALSVNNHPVGRQVQVNTNVYLPCQASGTPYLDIDYDWYFENVRIKFDRMDLDARRYDKSQFLRPYYRYFGTMVISNMQFYDEGNYTCRVTTPFNKIDYSALVQVLGPPGVVGGITIASSNGSFTNIVEWTDGNKRGKEIISYNLEVTKAIGEQNWKPLAQFNMTNVTVVDKQNFLKRNQYKFSGLPANTNFQLRMSATNEFGTGEPSGPSDIFKTAPTFPMKPPQNVTGGGGKVRTLVIRWEPLTKLEENGDNFYYDIHYKEEKEIEWILVSNPLNQSLENNKYRQSTIFLPPNKDYIPYNVRVRAVNIVGSGPWSEISTITSASKLPGNAPQNVHASSYNSTAIFVDWTPPSRGVGEGPFIGYHIVYWLRLSDCKSTAASVNRLLTSQRLTLYGETLASGIIIGLVADHYYCIGVQVMNTAGESLESSFVDQTTFKKPPQNFPTVMRLNSTNTPHQIMVTWNGVRVMPEEESVDGYRMRYWLSGAPVRDALDVDVGLKITGLLNNLLYNVRYNLRIYAYSRGGNGKLSNPMDQFMLVPRSRCENNKIIEGPDVRFVFVCTSYHLTTSISLLIVGLLVTKLFV